jgi:hypothetical protein
MCKAFSCIVGIDGKVYWKAGLDGHEDIRKEFSLLDKANSTPIEITLKEGYLHPEAEWLFTFYAGCPDWWKKSHHKHAYEALKEWKEQVYSKINLSEAINPIHPLRLPFVKKVNKAQIKLLVEWGSVWKSVWESVWESVRESVGESVWESVRESVGESVWAYIGSLFNLPRDAWKYTENIKTKKYPFESVVKLWKMGIVPSFDGRVWRLHSGAKTDVVFEITKEELMQLKFEEI